MANLPRKLQPDDVLFRALAPTDQYDDEGPLRAGFEDTGGSPRENSTTLSFSVKGEATASDALRVISKRRLVKERCGTGNNPATPEQMYDHGWRVAALPASIVLKACSTPDTPISIFCLPNGDEVEAHGHLQIEQGDKMADTWARHAAILSKEDTLNI